MVLHCVATCSLHRQGRSATKLAGKRARESHGHMQPAQAGQMLQDAESLCGLQGLQALLRCMQFSLHRLASRGHWERGRPLLQQTSGSGFMQPHLPVQVPINLHISCGEFSSSVNCLSICRSRPLLTDLPPSGESCTTGCLLPHAAWQTSTASEQLFGQLGGMSSERPSSAIISLPLGISSRHRAHDGHPEQVPKLQAIVPTSAHHYSAQAANNRQSQSASTHLERRCGLVVWH